MAGEEKPDRACDNRDSATQAGKKSPKVDRETLHPLADWFREDPEEAFVMQVYFRGRSMMDMGDLPRSAIALETMESAFSAFEEGWGHAEIADAYPVEAWKNDTVEIPRAWVRELVRCWRTYKDGAQGTDFGEAFGIDGRGQGSRPVRSKLQALGRSTAIRNQVLSAYLTDGVVKGRVSWNAAIEAVAEAEGLSTDTVKRTLGDRDEILVFHT